MPQIKTHRTCYSTHLKASSERVVRRTSTSLKWTNLFQEYPLMEEMSRMRLSLFLMVLIPAPSRSTRSSRKWPKKSKSFKTCAPKLRAIGTTLSRTWWKTLELMSSVRGTQLSMRADKRLFSQRIYRCCRNSSSIWFLTKNNGPVLSPCACSTSLLNLWRTPRTSITSTMRTETSSRKKLMTCDALNLRRYSLIGWMILLPKANINYHCKNHYY